MNFSHQAIPHHPYDRWNWQKINVTPGLKSPIILIIAACLLVSKSVDIVTSFFGYNEY